MKIHTTKLYVPSNGESNSAEISAEVPKGTGNISLSIQKPGSSNHILGPNGWQSADYWFNGSPSEFSNNNVAWFSLPAQLVAHITYSNYSVFCRRTGNSTQTRTILTGGALVAKPAHASLPIGDIELPPLPTDFSQAALGSLAAVEESDATPEISTFQSEAVSTLPTAEPKVASHSAETVSAYPASEKAAVFDTPMPKQAPSSTTQQQRFHSNHPILLGLLAIIFLVITVYFFGFRNTSKNDGANNAQPPVSTMKPETAPVTAPAKPEIPAKDGSNIAKPNLPEVKQAPANLPSRATAEPTQALPTPEKAQPPGFSLPEVKQAPANLPSKATAEPTQTLPTPQKAQPPGSSAPDLNRMVNEVLKR
jgi:hypothetical protein